MHFRKGLDLVADELDALARAGHEEHVVLDVELVLAVDLVDKVGHDLVLRGVGGAVKEDVRDLLVPVEVVELPYDGLLGGHVTEGCAHVLGFFARSGNAFT